jgi:hypothetical protein
MAGHTRLSDNLRPHLLALVAGTASHEQVNGVIAACHALAASFLASKSSAGLLIRTQGLTLDDLAYDCIAELFRQDTSGFYIQLQSYFAGISIATVSDEELLSHLRRLVFSKVNHGVFRLCSEADPSLARILRNMKLAMQSLRQWIEVDRFGEPCMLPGMTETLEHLPPFERDELTTALENAVTGKELIPELLGKLARVLREQHACSRIIPFMTVGMVIRACYERKALPATEVTAEGTEIPIDLQAIVRDACRATRIGVAEKYLAREKVTGDQLDLYFAVIERELYGRYANDGHAHASLFEILRDLRPEITKHDYIRRHRNRLEYLLKLVRNRAAGALKSS